MSPFIESIKHGLLSLMISFPSFVRGATTRIVPALPEGSTVILSRYEAATSIAMPDIGAVLPVSPGCSLCCGKTGVGVCEAVTSLVIRPDVCEECKG